MLSNIFVITWQSAKGRQLRIIVRGEFKKNMNEKDEERIAALKGNAVRALANYLMIESSANDPKLKDKFNAFAKSEADTMKPDK